MRSNRCCLNPRGCCLHQAGCLPKGFPQHLPKGCFLQAHPMESRPAMLVREGVGAWGLGAGVGAVGVAGEVVVGRGEGAGRVEGVRGGRT